jgi:FKBP-type peptidyl-prolyl cis-trans isomerase
LISDFLITTHFLIFAANPGKGPTMSRLKIIVTAVLAALVVLISSCNRDLVDPAEQAAIDVNAIDEYIASSGITAYKDITGARFSITTLGTGGFPPLFDQQSTVMYSGRMLDGTEFDEGTSTNYVGAYILGWQRMLPLLPKGTKATIFIPSGMGYGPTGYGPIPGNAVLVFDVEMQDVIVSASEKIRAQGDVASIDSFLADNNITAITDTTGVRYVIIEQGTDVKPDWFSRVKFNYKGTVLTASESFTTGVAEPSGSTDSRVVDYIHGVKFGLMQLGIGGKGTFYIPSGLAFGANSGGSAAVPAHANLVYELELLEIVPEP